MGVVCSNATRGSFFEVVSKIARAAMEKETEGGDRNNQRHS